MSAKGPAPAAQVLIAAYRPHTVSAAVGQFARAAAAAGAPQSPARAKALLYCASRLGAFAQAAGLELEPQALFCEAAIERFIACATQGLSPATVRTLRSNLRALQGALSPVHEPAPRALPRERAKPPYTPAELELLLSACAALCTPARRAHASALICLGAGAGVIGTELRHLKGADVIARFGGVLVCVPGERARSVPLLARYQAPLLRAADFAGEGYLIGGREPERRNLSDQIAGWLKDPSLPRLQAARLRSSWLCEVAGLIGLHAFMAAAGVRCSQRLGDIAACLPAPSEPELIALLGGAS